MPDLVVGATVAGCRLEAIAGQGGMGVVWRAVQLALNRPVAMKAIAPHYARDAAFRERFQRESQLAASIEHPNVIPVYEAGELDDLLYLIMRWVDGTDLRELLTARGRLAPRNATRLLIPVAQALGAAHRRGLIHRDVKPANVLISAYESDDEHVYLTDFGIARRTDSNMTMTGTGQLVGTLDYIAPERIEGAKGDARSDIYAFGCMLYEALTGEVPYNRDTDVTKMYAHLNDPVPSARAAAPGVPERLDQIIAKAMAKQPADRFGSAEELVAALGTVGGEPRLTEPALGTDGEKSRATEPALGTDREETGATEPGRTAGGAEPEDRTIGAHATAVPDEGAVTTSILDTPSAVHGGATQPQPDDSAPTIAQRRPARRRTSSWVIPIVGVVIIIGVLAVVLSSGGGAKRPATVAVSNSGPSGQGAASTGGLYLVTQISLPGTPTAITAEASTNRVWIAGPGYVVTEPEGLKMTFNGTPTAIAAGDGQMWISDQTAGELRRFSTSGGKLIPAGAASSSASLLALDPRDGSAYASDATGRVAHIGANMQFTQLGVVNPPPVALAFGEGNWLWAVNGNQLTRIDPRVSVPVANFPDGSDPVSVTLNQGVWTAHGDGHVTRFDPRRTYTLPNGTTANGLHVNANIAVAAPAPLAMIASIERGADVWAASSATRTVYRIDYATGRVTGTLRLPEAPTGLAVTPTGVWAITRSAKLFEIA